MPISDVFGSHLGFLGKAPRGFWGTLWDLGLHNGRIEGTSLKISAFYNFFSGSYRSVTKCSCTNNTRTMSLHRLAS